MFIQRQVFWALLILGSSFTVFSQTDDWKQFSSSTTGYKINYPSDWNSTEDWMWPVGHLRLRSPEVRDDDVFESAFIEICSKPKGFASKPSISTSQCRLRDDHNSASAKNRIVSQETIEIDGIRIRKTVSEDRYHPEATFLDASFLTADRDIMINGRFPRRFNLEQYIPVFDKLLSTLQVLDKPTVLTYSNKKYGFSLEYSSAWKSCPVDDHRQKELILRLVPEESICLGSNSISISTVTGKLKPSDWSDIDSLIKARTNQREEDKYFYRQSCFRTGTEASGNLLQVSEMYNREQEIFKRDGEAILKTFKTYP